MPSFETGISRAFAKSGPSGSTIVKSSVLMNWLAPISTTSLGSEIGGRIGRSMWNGGCESSRRGCAGWPCQRLLVLARGVVQCRPTRTGKPVSNVPDQARNLFDGCPVIARVARDTQQGLAEAAVFLGDFG